MTGAQELAQYARRLPVMLRDLERLVSAESPSQDREAVARSAHVLAELGEERIGAPPELIVLDGRTHLRWRLGVQDESPRLLILGHHDTVFPVGSLQRLPFSAEAGVARGPGCLDMKAGLVMILHALASLQDPGNVTLLVTGDEEIGSPSSRALIEQEARASTACLVAEAAADSGALKVERKGVSTYQVEVTGRAAHAGLNPHAGVNATIELAHQIVTVAGLSDAAQGTTVTPTVAASGSSVNTVPEHADFWVDARCRTRAEQDRVHLALSGLVAAHPEAVLRVTGSPNRAPMEAGSSAALFGLARAEAAVLGVTVTGAAVGGGSDGNLTSGVGTPTLDGLGAVGGGPHTADEHVRIDELAPRTALLARLVRRLADPHQASLPAADSGSRR